MIHLLNRRELLTTYHMEEQSRVREILSANQIGYIVKTRNRTGAPSLSPSSRGRMGSYGVNTAAMYEYLVYVKKDDYEKALYLIRK